VLLVLYGLYLYSNADDSISGEVGEIPKNNYVLFISHFSVVFAAELGDKTQIATLAVAVKNQTHLLTVFSASALALVTVTAITVWGITKIPSRWVKKCTAYGGSWNDSLWYIYVLFDDLSSIEKAVNSLREFTAFFFSIFYTLLFD